MHVCVCVAKALLAVQLARVHTAHEKRATVKEKKHIQNDYLGNGHMRMECQRGQNLIIMDLDNYSRISLYVCLSVCLCLSLSVSLSLYIYIYLYIYISNPDGTLGCGRNSWRGASWRGIQGWMLSLNSRGCHGLDICWKAIKMTWIHEDFSVFSRVWGLKGLGGRCRSNLNYPKRFRGRLSPMLSLWHSKWVFASRAYLERLATHPRFIHRVGGIPKNRLLNVGYVVSIL